MKNGLVLYQSAQDEGLKNYKRLKFEKTLKKVLDKSEIMW